MQKFQFEITSFSDLLAVDTLANKIKNLNLLAQTIFLGSNDLYLLLMSLNNIRQNLRKLLFPASKKAKCL